MNRLKLIARAAALAVVCLGLFGGCTMVSEGRVFPKFTWYWSKDARQQRADQERQKEWHRSMPTNSPAL